MARVKEELLEGPVLTPPPPASAPDARSAGDLADAIRQELAGTVAPAPAVEPVATPVPEPRGEETVKSPKPPSPAAVPPPAPAPAPTSAPSDRGADNTPGGTTFKTTEKTPLTAEQRNAYSLVMNILTPMGLGELADTVYQLMQENVGPDTALTQLRYDTSINPSTNKPWNDAYAKRFAGNEIRRKANIPTLDEQTYLATESKFADIFNMYGQNKYATQQEFADLIGNRVNPVELQNRLDLAVNRVNNADQAIKNQLKAYYPNITDSDLVAYFLKPEQTLPELQQKVTSAEIGAAAAGQNLGVSQARATELAQYGIDRAAALKGYAEIGAVLPTAEKLQQIYDQAGVQYGQTGAEEEFLKGTASAARARQKLKALETSSFSGASGVSPQGYSLDRATYGSF